MTGLPFAGRVVAVWLILIVAESIHGVLRAVLLTPYIGDFRARQAGVLIGSALILGIAILLAGWLGARSTKELVLAGLLWLALTVAFEVVFGHFVAGLSWERLREDYDLTKGGLLPFGLIVLTLSPLIAARLRGLKN